MLWRCMVCLCAVFRKAPRHEIAGTNPRTAAVETLKALQIYATIQSKIVQGNSIAQTFQFIDTGNAELGFIALSQIIGNTTGSRWLVPQELYTPIRQDAVLLKKGASDDAAKGFMSFLKGPEARTVSSTTIVTTSNFSLPSPRRTPWTKGN